MNIKLKPVKERTTRFHFLSSEQNQNRMAAFNCFCPSWNKNKHKGDSVDEDRKNFKTLHVNLQTSSSETRSTSFNVSVPFPIPAISSSCNVKVTNQDCPVAADASFETLQMNNDSEQGMESSLSSPPNTADDVRNNDPYYLD